MNIFLTIFISTLFIVNSYQRCSSTASWKNIKAYGAQPYLTDKPNFIQINRQEAVLFNGVTNNCTSGDTLPHDNSKIYVYNTRFNYGRYVRAFGDIPDSAFFVSAWRTPVSGEIMMAGGIFYNEDFSIIDIKSYEFVYKLTVGYFAAVWKKINTTGTEPSPRTEMSVIQDEDNLDEVFLYGGVSLDFSVGGFVSLPELFKYTISTNTYELLDLGIPDSKRQLDLLPLSRYHAHIFFSNHNGCKELEIHQGVHTNTSNGSIENVELDDSWRFNLQTLTWRRIFPQPPINYQRRHGANFQIKKGSRQLFCIVSGDGTFENQIPTLGCPFAISTISDMVCSNPATNDDNGSWQTIPTSGDNFKPAKYPAAVRINNKVYMISGSFASPISPQENQQKFHDEIRIINTKRIQF